MQSSFTGSYPCRDAQIGVLPATVWDVPVTLSAAAQACGSGCDASCDCRCPECAPGSLDLATEGNGRWLMQWVPIPCNVGQSTFFYHAVSNLSNPYYYAFSVSNTRYDYLQTGVLNLPYRCALNNLNCVALQHCLGPPALLTGVQAAWTGGLWLALQSFLTPPTRVGTAGHKACVHSAGKGCMLMHCIG